ncbi:HNH endonuclease signature motif containing protein [Pseudoxanthomonas sp. F11]|uniref:HNH endonuclease signature motif containing protein n=1 Tax=Pseudoxanthomonas sp. F11 TaxID=3126308 RepID=UPI00300C3C79
MHGRGHDDLKRYRRSPYRALRGGLSTNALSNGPLLRTDIHALFDAGLLTIGPDLVVYLRSGVDDPYYRSLDGKALALTVASKISTEALRRRMAGGESLELEAGSVGSLP